MAFYKRKISTLIAKSNNNLYENKLNLTCYETFFAIAIEPVYNKNII